MQTCNRAAHARKVRALKAKVAQVEPDMRPLFKHLLKLSIDSAKSGYCQRAGRELRSAKKWLRPQRLNGGR